MNFYRHWYGNNELREYILGDFSRLGFYDENGDPVEGNLCRNYPYPKSDEGYELPEKLYWHNDNLHRSYIRGVRKRDTTGSSQTSYWYSYSYRITLSDPNLNSNENIGYNGDYNSLFTGSINYNAYNVSINFPVVSGICFIPLKNGGFLLNIQNASLTNPGDTRIIVKPTIPIRVMPRTYGDQKGRTLGTSDDGWGITRFISFIGLPPTNKSVLNDYAYISSNYIWNENYPPGAQFLSGNNTGDNDLTPIIDLQNGNASSTIFKMHNSSMRDPSTNKQYMNFSPNVCVLSKVPYDNGFIDNLYYMVTCPTSGISDDNYRGIFFSFEGRNFINIYGNMVLELPGY